MINITDKSQCCGCNACVQRCPKQCVTMQEDEEGFLYPKVDHAACIDCGLCEKVCPVGNITVTDRPVWGGNCTQCLACYHVCPVHAVEYGKMTGKKGQYKGRLLKDL